MGPEARLDGLFFIFSKASFKSVSSSWHTDNVGSRLKAFVCIEGDGTQPTLIFPPSNRNFNFAYLIKNYWIELLRWFGIEFKLNIESSISLKHKSKSIYMFDTKFLHRGAYEIGNKDRLILVFEFSDPRKHKIFSRGFLKGPIGTNESNKFFIDLNVILSMKMKNMLDKKRIKYKKDIIEYSN